jgi:hypothetical protein
MYMAAWERGSKKETSLFKRSEKCRHRSQLMKQSSRN